MIKIALVVLVMASFMLGCFAPPKKQPNAKQYYVRCWVEGEAEPFYSATVSSIEMPGTIAHAWRFDGEVIISETAICFIEPASRVD